MELDGSRARAEAIPSLLARNEFIRYIIASVQRAVPFVVECPAGMVSRSYHLSRYQNGNGLQAYPSPHAAALAFDLVAAKYGALSPSAASAHMVKALSAAIREVSAPRFQPLQATALLRQDAGGYPFDYVKTYPGRDHIHISLLGDAFIDGGPGTVPSILALDPGPSGYRNGSFPLSNFSLDIPGATWSSISPRHIASRYGAASGSFPIILR
jgi:hypothetical protein